MRFFSTLVKNCYDLPTLKASRLSPRAAWKFFFLFTLLVTVVTFIPFFFVASTAIPEIKNSLIAKVPNFAATLHGGELSVTGITVPYVYRTAGDEGNFVFVLDTVTTGTVALSDYLGAKESGVLIAKDRIEMYRDDQGMSRTEYFKNVADGKFSKDDLAAAIASLTKPGPLALFAAGFLVFGYIGITLGKLLGILVASLFVYLVARIAKKPFRWADLFVIGLSAVVLPSIISLLLTFTGLAIGNVYLLALVAFLLAIVFTKDESVSAPVEPPKPTETPKA